MSLRVSSASPWILLTNALCQRTRSANPCISLQGGGGGVQAQPVHVGSEESSHSKVSVDKQSGCHALQMYSTCKCAKLGGIHCFKAPFTQCS